MTLKRCSLFLIFVIVGALFGAVPSLAAATWYASAEAKANDSNPGTMEQPVATVKKAVSLAKPGDTVVFAAGTNSSSDVSIPDGAVDLPIIVRSSGSGKVIFSNDGSADVLMPGSYNTIDGIEIRMVSDKPRNSGIHIVRKEHTTIRNCRIFACRHGIRGESTHNLTITNCEIAYAGYNSIYIHGSGNGEKGHWNPADENRNVEIRNCYIHDAGWGVDGTEGYGFNAQGGVESLLIENCQIDNCTGDGILYEDWAVHSTARHNIIRGSGIAAIWIDNVSMSIFDGNYLEANNVSIWLSGEESSNRYQSDFISIRNNIMVHNDWTALAAFDPKVYGKNVFHITSNTRDVYVDNNTIAFNNAPRVVGVENRPPQNIFSNIWFRNNLFYGNTGGIGGDRGVDMSNFHFLNNLWDKPYKGDKQAKTGDPMFVDAKSHSPEGYKIRGGSAAIDQGMLLYDNPLDFWDAARPHLSTTEKYDIGAHEFGATGVAHIGLDMSTFPFEVPPFKLQFRAKPPK